ncbi:c-type cytochrome [Rhodocytophaga rosea]|uniref:C-type cytochrome n=1 Tax=Rhodocytophaga rosea TaxID=2704465 RepID=A0A6C0GFM8_9BACT|nr:PVC-type heme-binding CxxCH protein [Rhodocytophaga rosea]QHT66757.1 c-type cytochrome [Rhodocytophaga rosea]
MFNKLPHYPLNYSSLLCLCVLPIMLAGCKKSAVPKTEAEEKALASFQLEPGFKIELLASEPLISDPVAMEIDEYGRLYVVEMHGYPLDKSGSGKIKLLTDTDGDGKMDESTIFAENLTLPTGIMRWKKGVLITDPPHVWYLEDTNNDGKADIKKSILEGFALSNPQHNVNNPLYGLDNWIYLGHEAEVTAKVYTKEFGDTGKDIIYTDKPNGPRLPDNAQGRGVRFKPDSFGLEMTSSDTQFGHTFDAWGNWFLVTNYNHVFHEVIAASYLMRNPDLLISDATQSLSDHANAAEVFPITQNPQHQLLTDLGVITSACGINYYQGGAFPPGFDSVTFVAEPVSNLIHADRIQPKGASFTASRLRPKQEFLASTDAWFRPVNLYTGPDGAMYVVDYYRQIIEHPEWMAEDVVKSGALYNGTDKGRIYRISKRDAKPADWTKGLSLGDATDDQLIEYLASSNIWWRRNAQRLLIDRGSKNTITALTKMAQQASSPLGRLHALWTLEGMGELQSELITKALQDAVHGVRVNAIKLAELHLETTPTLAEPLVAMQTDTDAKVRYQLLCTLGFINTPEADQARQKLLFRDINDNWVQIAALSAPASQQSGLLDAVLKQFNPDNPAHASLVSRLSAMAGASQKAERIHPLIEKATAPMGEKASIWQASILEGLAKGLKSKETKAGFWQEEKKLLTKTCVNHPSIGVRKGSLAMLKVIGLPEKAQTQMAMQQALKQAGNHQLPEEERAQAILFLSLINPEPYFSFLTTCISPEEPLPVQSAALEAMSTIPGQKVGHYVIEQWTSLTPDMRDMAINTFMSDPERIQLLLDALEKGQIQSSSLGWRRSVHLMSYEDEKLRNRARMLLTKQDSSKPEVISQYQAALTMTGKAEQGKLVFQKNCTVCHQMEGNGTAFGPELSSIKNRPPASIMNDILNPNASIADGYDLWTVELKNGESLQGIIATETPTAITLRNAGGQENTVARQDIKSLTALTISAMPAGLEKQINQQDMADLLAYIRQIK